MLNLLCTAPHAAIPAIAVGVTIAAETSPAGFTFRVPSTRTVLRNICTAIHDGALQVEGACDPIWDEIERQLTLDRDRLRAQAEALLTGFRAVG